MTKSWALGFATCHKQELFVAQELITKKNQIVAEFRFNYKRNDEIFSCHYLRNVTAGCLFQQ